MTVTRTFRAAGLAKFHGILSIRRRTAHYGNLRVFCRADRRASGAD
jgi:hypothetical protein